MTLYEDLELNPDCSIEDIKQQYRTLARIYHPDLGGDEEKFKRIKFAYEVLSDPVRRKEYDENKTTSEPINIRHEAIQELASIFNRIMPNFDPNSGSNLVELMKEDVVRAIVKIHSDIAQCEKYINNLKVVNTKVKSKKENDDNVIEAFVIQQIEWRNRDLDVFKKRIEIANLMLDIINDYQYGFLELINELTNIEITGGNGEI